MSTSISNNPPAVQVRNLDLSFSLRLHPEVTLRGQFVRFIKSPIATLLQHHDSFHVLKDISFDASIGDRIAIVGKNGAGKTTLCRCLTGFYMPQHGDVQVRGSIRSIIDPSAVIYPELTGRENAKIMMALMYPEKKNIPELLDEALNFSGLGAHLDKPFRTYSNGMQTRLCLSLATCASADVFILDEVFEGADEEFQKQVSERILNLISNSGIVFFVSHSESQIRRVCNKGILLHQGRILLYGPIDDVLLSYSQLNNG